MEYTYQEKCVAAIECKLWWRFPDSLESDERKWSLITDDRIGVEPSDLKDPEAEYHIGDEPPKPPRVLSELEQELLAALVDVRRVIEMANASGELAVLDAAIAKAKGEA